MLGPVSIVMGDHLWAGKPFRYVTSHQRYSAFYPLWDAKMASAFGLSNNIKWWWWIQFTSCL